MQIRIVIASVVLMLGASANAGEAHTSYRISRTGATVTTAVLDPSPVQVKVLEGYLFESLVVNLKSVHGVTGVTALTEREESVDEHEDASEYVRRYPVRVKLAMPNPVVLTLQVEEGYTKCKAGYACRASAYLKVTSGFQQDISIQVQREGREAIRIVSHYNLNSVILGGKANHERNTIMVAAARALRANNEKMVQ